MTLDADAARSMIEQFAGLPADVTRRLDADAVALPNVAAKREELIASLATDHHLRRYLEDQEKAGQGVPITSPRRAIAERNSWALLMVSGAVETGSNAVADKGMFAFVTAQVLATAPVFLWDDAIRQLAGRGTLPRHIVGDHGIPHNTMYWTWPGALVGTDADLESVLIVKTLLGLTAFAFIRPGVGPKPGSHDDTRAIAVRVSEIRFGARYPEEVSEDWVALLQLIAFLNSPFIETRRERSLLPKTQRCHGRRIGDPEAVTVVRLRASVHKAVAVQRGEGPVWKQRWLVRGHYRAQWYPGSGTHKVIWIAPYLKGPEDAPLSTPTYVVTR